MYMKPNNASKNMLLRAQTANKNLKQNVRIEDAMVYKFFSVIEALC